MMEVLGLATPKPASNHSLLRGERFPGEACPRAEIVPIGVIGTGAPAIDAGELHHAGRTGYGIDLLEIKTVHPIGAVLDRRIRLQSQPDIHGRLAGAGPGFWNEPGK